ncbi:hypothetical protein HK103_001643 [Boothiomyces macroporosus]|uniref:Uncharacterized protein n=1 Tax=Boothiomyces macroporosus TaxID=261099 RepID=A0AAD5Y557_9FUNG|nr:hypothetical protein HK103_001643 [Boothiomyces macroporosus]
MSSNPTFNNKTTAEEVATVFKHRIKGKHVVITGANIGLGKETARVLAKEGAIITICCRTVSKGEEAKADILKETADANITVVPLDLSNLKSVKKCAEDYISTGKPIDILINNAGVMACPLTKTADGFETQFGTNHLGHFYFTELLLPVLEKSGTKDEPSRVVNLASLAAVLFAPKAGILFDDINGEKHYNSWERYGQSKLANILYTVELNDRMKKEGKHVIAVSLHPGNIAATNLTQHIGVKSAFEMVWQINKSLIPKIMASKNIPQGTATSIVCAFDPKIEPGKYYYDCQLGTLYHPLSYDEELALKLTKFSHELIEKATQ